MAYSDTILADSPKGYWPLDDSSGSSTVVDLATSPHNGTVGAGTTLGATGKHGTAMSTTGASGQGVSIGAGNVLGSGWSALTLEAWVKTTSGTNGLPIIWNDNESSARNWRLSLKTGGLPEILFWNASGSLGIATSSVAVHDGNWHHVVGVYNGTNVLIYVDGTQRGSATNSGNAAANAAATLLIGRHTNGSSFNGTIDEAAIYSTALSPSQISAHYAFGAPAGDGRLYATSTDVVVVRETPGALYAASVDVVMSEAPEPPSGPTWWVWNGTTEEPATPTIWNGTTEVAVSSTEISS